MTVLACLATATPAARPAAPPPRGWELVSPPAKQGSDVIAETSRTRAAAGETPQLPMAAAFASLGGFGDVRGMGISTEYVAQRTAIPGTSGWTTHAITPPQLPLTLRAAAQNLDPLYEGEMAEDLSRGLFRAWSPLTGAPNVRTVENLYLREDLRSPGAGAYRLLTDAPAPLQPIQSSTERPYLAAATGDLGQVLVESRLPLAAGASRGNPMLYKSAHGVVTPIAGDATCPGVTGLSTSPTAPCSVAGMGVSALRRTDRTLSADGERAVFTSPVTGVGAVQTAPGAESRLYQHDDRGTSTTGDDTVVQVSASERTVPDAPQAAFFQTASTDGDRIYFTSGEQLTDAPGSGLYLWTRASDAGGRHLTLVVPADDPAVIGASEDGRRVYLAAIGQLVPGGPAVSEYGVYLWQDDGGTLSYVGALPRDDVLGNVNATPWSANPRLSRVTPDGRVLLLTTSDGSGLLAGADHGRCAANPNATSLAACSQVYVYRGRRLDAARAADRLRVVPRARRDGGRQRARQRARRRGRLARHDAPQPRAQRRRAARLLQHRGRARRRGHERQGRRVRVRRAERHAAAAVERARRRRRLVHGRERERRRRLLHHARAARRLGRRPGIRPLRRARGGRSPRAAAGSDAVCGRRLPRPAERARTAAAGPGERRDRRRRPQRCASPQMQARVRQKMGQRQTALREKSESPAQTEQAEMRRALAGALLALAVAASPALAAPAWRLDVLSDTTAAPGGVHTYTVQVTNVGDATMNLATSPVTLSGSYPAGLTVLTGATVPPSAGTRWDCGALVVGAQSFRCQLASGTIAPWGSRVVTVDASVGAGATGELTGSFAVAGGGPGVAPATRADPTRVTTVEPAFGVDAFDGEVVDAAGAPFTQAGGHPPEASVSIDFNTTSDPAPLKGRLWPVEPVRDVLADLPPGLVGDPTAAATCTAAQLANTEAGLLAKALCPPDAQVGTALVRLQGIANKTVWGPLPIFNMVPPPDVPARFGFNVAGTVVVLDGELRSATDYGLSVRVRNIPQGLAIAGATLTFWGEPSDEAHDRERACTGERAPWEGGPACESGAVPRAFLRVPTSCTPAGVGLPVAVQVDSWARPGAFEQATFVSHRPPGYPAAPVDWGPEIGPEGCAAVPFSPGMSVAPGSLAAGAPSGFAFEVTLPQRDDPSAVGQSDLRRAVVRLPVGVRVNPSAADGLQGCSAAEIGLDSLAPVRCPDGSRVGSLTIATPLLDEPLAGSVYLASPRVNPLSSLLAVYLVARGPGLVVKLAGRVEADLLTGRLTAVLDELPQLPFSSVRLAFDGGPRAPLVNPPVCGAYEVETELTGWSGAGAVVRSPFAMAFDAAGAPCPVDASGVGAAAGPRARPFAPGFAAGVENPLAGGSSPFHVRLTRTDADEELAGLSLRLPRGLLGRVADVVLCGEGDAAGGTCPEGSLVGRVAAGAGAGPLPFWIRDGRVYLTGPHRGAPFGLSIVVPAVAGPFDLGLVVVRAALRVHRRTAAVSVDADPLPTILRGHPAATARRAGGGGPTGLHGAADELRRRAPRPGRPALVVGPRRRRVGPVRGRRLRPPALRAPPASDRGRERSHARGRVDAPDRGADPETRRSRNPPCERDPSGRAERAARGGGGRLHSSRVRRDARRPRARSVQTGAHRHGRRHDAPPARPAARKRLPGQEDPTDRPGCRTSSSRCAARSTSTSSAGSRFRAVACCARRLPTYPTSRSLGSCCGSGRGRGGFLVSRGISAGRRAAGAELR